MYLQKSLKNTYPTVWHLDFAILLTWQKERNIYVKPVHTWYWEIGAK